VHGEVEIVLIGMAFWNKVPRMMNGDGFAVSDAISRGT